MIEFELDKAWGGWKNTSTPDNLEITVRTKDTVHHMEASLREIIETYATVIQGAERTFSVGTGSAITIKWENGRVRFKKPPLNILTTEQDLRDAFESLLAEIFEAQNQEGSLPKRIDQIEYLETWLDRRGVPIDVSELYDELSK